MIDKQQVQNRDAKEITEAGKVARFYGFRPIDPPALEKKDFEIAKALDSAGNTPEKSALLRVYFEEKMIIGPQPNLLYCERPFPVSKSLPPSKQEKKKPNRLESSLHCFGSDKSVCECLAIQTALSILDHIGHKDLEVQVNSVGDKDSMNEFQKKLALYVRKNMNAFPADLRQALKKDICAILKERKEEWGEFREDCPKPIDFLSETSRLHFKEVLEFLEIMGIPYRIDSHLIGDLNIGSETVFSIKNGLGLPDSKQEDLAYGLRWSRIAKKMGYKKDVSCVSLDISAKLKKPLKKVKPKAQKPQFYLVQFGPEAKLKSFVILDRLYKAGAQVLHAIAKDKLSTQMGVAETSATSYILLIGQKEALEDSVIVRNAATHAQELVPICEFPAKIKEIMKEGLE